MTVDPRTSSLDLPIEWSQLSQAAVDEMTAAMAAAYVATYRGPHPGAPNTEAADTVGAKAGRKARQFRDAAEEAWEKAYDAAQARNGGQPGARPTPEAERIRWYRTLELEPGADLATVRKSYRRLLKQYHPDRFAKDPEKYKAATEVTRNITAAYDGLTTLLGG